MDVLGQTNTMGMVKHVHNINSMSILLEACLLARGSQAEGAAWCKVPRLIHKDTVSSTDCWAVNDLSIINLIKWHLPMDRTGIKARGASSWYW